MIYALSNIFILAIPILLIELSETANAIEIQNSSQRKYKSVSISEKTYNRLARYGHWSESADQLINRILDEQDGKENVSETSAS
jgi:hypothetical protein